MNIFKLIENDNLLNRKKTKGLEYIDAKSKATKNILGKIYG